MSDPFIGEVRIFPFNFAPLGWAFCNGQTIPIIQNTALFSLLGTMYGGDGRTNFCLPDLRGRAAMCPGQGPGLSRRSVAEVGGTETVTLTVANAPAHSHQIGTADGEDPADRFTPTGASLGRSNNGQAYADAQNLVGMSTSAMSPFGAGGSHNNMQPYLPLNFNIALQGIYPTRE